jgi:hypothetical protein
MRSVFITCNVRALRRECGAQAPGAPYTPGSYLRVRHSWKDGDKVVIDFPMALWASPLNDYHPVCQRMPYAPTRFGLPVV